MAGPSGKKEKVDKAGPSGGKKKDVKKETCLGLRSQSLRLGACNVVYYSKLEIPMGERNGFIESNALIHDKYEGFPRFYELSWNSSTGEEDDLESLLGGDELQFEEELSGDKADIEGAELGLHSEAGKITASKRSSELFKAIVSVLGLSVATALDKWVEDGKEINNAEIANAMLQLRRRHMYGRALQLHITSCLRMSIKETW